MVDTVQSAIYRLALNGAEYERDSRLVQAANEKLMDGFNRLEARVDKTIAAERRLAQGIVQAARFREEGLVSQARYDAQLDRLLGRYEGQVAAQHAVGESAADMATVFSTLRGTLATFGITLGTIGLARFATDALKAAGDLGELSQQLGIGTTALQTYRFAATQAGVEQSNLESAISTFTRTVGDAAAGGAKQLAFFNELGVGILDANGRLRDTEEILLDVAEALSLIDDPARRAALEVDGFGKSGQKLDTILADGRDGIQEYREEMERLGLYLSDEQIRNADRATDAFAKLRYEIDLMIQRIATGLAGPLADFLEWGRELGKPSPGVEKLNALVDLTAAQNRVRHFERLLAEAQRLEAEGALVLPGQGAAAIASYTAELEAARQQLLAAQLATLGPSLQTNPFDAPRTPGITPGTRNPPSTTDLDKAARDRAAFLKDQAAAAEELRRALAALEDQIDPVAGAERELAKAQDLLMLAHERGIPILGGYESAMAKVYDLYRDKLDPTQAAFDKLNEALDETARKSEAEARALGLSSVERAVYIARVEAENKLLAEGLSLQDDRAKAYIAEAEAIARNSAESQDRFDRMQRATDYFVNFVDRGADRIGSALTEGFAKGELKLLQIADVGRAVLSELIQLAIELSLINPFKNWATGGDLPTASTFFGILGSFLGAGGGYTSPGAAIGATSSAGLAGGQVGFARGGAFRVGGSGGTDSQLVSFRASPDEIVEVSRPDQMNRGGTFNLVQNIEINASGGTREQNQDLAERLSTQFRQATRDMIRQELVEQTRVSGLLRPSALGGI